MVGSLSKEEIISTLKAEKSKFFNIENFEEYADKVLKLGKAFVERDSDGQIIAYILYYDNQPEIFITMVWANPKYRGKGKTKKLLQVFIKQTDKKINLEVHRDNPALKLYESLGFIKGKEKNTSVFLYYKKIIAIMQPYIFPYIGYFQLLSASNKIIFYDDVQFIKGGWINRNRILINKKEFLFSIPLAKASSNKMINEIKPIIDESFIKTFFARIDAAYSKAPFYKQVRQMLQEFFNREFQDIGDLCIHSILAIYKYLDLKLNWSKSSVTHFGSKGMDRAERLISIVKKENYQCYVNAIGGQNLYNKDYFHKQGVELFFLKPGIISYNQLDNDFVPGLSIIDVLMFNEPGEVRKQFHNYKLF